jgi:hypothetical protein
METLFSNQIYPSIHPDGLANLNILRQRDLARLNIGSTSLNFGLPLLSPDYPLLKLDQLGSDLTMIENLLKS